MKNLTFPFLLSVLCLAPLRGQVSQNMTLLGQWTNASLPANGGVRFNDLWGYATGGREFAIVGSRAKVHFFEVTDPTNIVEVAAFLPGGSTTWRDMKTYGSYAYAVSDGSNNNEGLHVFNMTHITDPDPVLPGDPPRVSWVRQITAQFTRSHNIFVEQSTGFLYAVGVNSGVYNLIIYDLKPDPGNPTLFAQLNMTCGYSHDIFVEGHTAYTSSATNGHYIFDMSPVTTQPAGSPSGPPIQLARIDGYQFEGYSHSSWKSGNYMVFADETHGTPLGVVDLTDINNPEVKGRFHSNLLNVPNPTSSTSPHGPIVHNPFLIGNLCYVSHYHDGIVVFDISDPNSVQRVAYYDTHLTNGNYSGYQGAWGVYPFLPSGRIIGSDVLNGLFVLQPSGAALPVTWKHFTAQAKSQTVRLDWATGEERDNAGFTVQRLTADKQWQELGWVAAQATGQYQYTDEQPQRGWNTYRLEQRDHDGTLGYSKLVNAFVADARSAWRLATNPVRSGILTFITDDGQSTSTPLQLRLYDAYGRTLLQRDLPPQSLHHGPISDLPNGQYWYELRGEDGRSASGGVVVD